MKTIINICMLIGVACLSGCASSQVRQLQREKEMLTSELAISNTRITNLEQQTKSLRSNYNSQKRAGETLKKEKETRVSNIALVRREVRAFVKAQMQALSDFSENRELLDYVGGELISRPNVSSANLLLVDMQNTIPATGTLLGGKVISKSSSKVRFCILRPSSKGMVVIWTSKVFSLPKAGLATLTFDALVAVNKGDLIGLYVPGKVQVPFSMGTGDTRTIAGPVDTGMTIPPDSLSNRSGRMYSFGVTGFLQ